MLSAVHTRPPAGWTFDEMRWRALPRTVRGFALAHLCRLTAGADFYVEMLRVKSVACDHRGSQCLAGPIRESQYESGLGEKTLRESKVPSEPAPFCPFPSNLPVSSSASAHLSRPQGPSLLFRLG